MELVPFFNFMIDGKKLGTSVSLSIHDEVGSNTDSITAVVSDRFGAAWPDMTDKMCSAEFGYLFGEKVVSSEFKLGQVSYDYGNKEYTLTGQSIDFSKAAKVKIDRTHKEKTLEQIVSLMASENGLKPRVSDPYKSIFFKAKTQSNETNLNFLLKLAKELGATLKVGGGYLLFIERGEGKKANGEPIEPITLYPPDLLVGSKIIEKERPKYKSVSAKYFDVEKSDYVREKAGSGEPELSLKKTYPDKQAAKAAANAEFKNKKRESCILEVVMEGNVAIIAETPIKTIGIKSPDITEWIVQSVDHTIDGGGFVTRFTAEQRV